MGGQISPNRQVSPGSQTKPAWTPETHVPFVGRVEPPVDPHNVVYTMTNDPNGNSVVIYAVGANGSLTPYISVPTQGRGNGSGLDSLASQGSLIVSSDKRWLVVVNGGSQDVSLFRIVSPTQLQFVSKAPTGQGTPVSVTMYGDSIYVLSSLPSLSPGAPTPLIGTVSLSQFTVQNDMLIPGPITSLPASSYGQVSFTPDGSKLIITDKANKRILVYAVGPSIDVSGLSQVQISPSTGMTPFGLTFSSRGDLLVVNAGSGTVSSYEIRPDLTLQPISQTVASEQKAACWITTDGFNTYTSNTGSSSLSAYTVDRIGNVYLKTAVAASESMPLDLTFSPHRDYLFVLDPGVGGVVSYVVNSNGTLTRTSAPTPTGLPIYAQGLAAL